MRQGKTIEVNGKEMVIGYHLSERYKPINTENALSYFTQKGWRVQGRLRSSTLLGKENVTLLHPDYSYSNGDNLSIIFRNSNDGSARVGLYGGYLREACSNGLIIGDMEGFRAKHLGTIEEQLDNYYDKIAAHMESIKVKTDFMKNTILSDDDQTLLVQKVVEQLFNRDNKKMRVKVEKLTPYAITLLLRVNRVADQGSDLFTIFNRIQENIVRKGRLFYTARYEDKETNKVETKLHSVRANERKLTSFETNIKIAKAVDKFCELKKVA